MSRFLMLAVVLGICAVYVTAKPAQVKDVGELAMTEEEEEFFMKMATVILKAQALDGVEMGAFGELSSPEKRAPTGSGSCSVTGNVADCCGSFSFPFNLNGCVNGEYLPQNYGVHLKLTVNGNEIINREVSAVNPIPVCAGIPGIRLASACVQLSNNHIGSNGGFSTCIALSARVFFRTVASLDLGCFSTN